MNNGQNGKFYWGIGLENETYLQFEESLIVSGEFIQEKLVLKNTVLIIENAINLKV